MAAFLVQWSHNQMEEVMAETLTVNREMYLGQIVATDGDLALLVASLEAMEGEMSPEDFDKATEALETKLKEYHLSVDEMNRVYELIRDNLASTVK